jgi:4-amino-4-deoxy-L-arabinose transferase-like glycosyltransferase
VKEYIIAIITVSIVGGIAFALVSTKDARLKKYVRLVISLIFLIVLIIPIKNAVSQVNSFKDNIDSFFSSIGINVDYSNNLIINSSIDNILKSLEKTFMSIDYNYYAAECEYENISCHLIFLCYD